MPFVTYLTGKQFSRFVSVSFNAPIRRMDVAAPARAYPEIAATQKVQYIPIGPHKSRFANDWP